MQLQQHTMALAAPSDQSDSFGMAARMNLPWQELSHDMTCESGFKFQLRNGEDLGYTTDCQPGFFCTNRRGCAPHFVFDIIL